MTDLEKAARMALEALENLLNSYYADNIIRDDCTQSDRAITALRQALEQAEFDRVHEALEKESGIHVSQQCVCGEPDSSGTHRTDGPCYAEQPAQQEPVAFHQVYRCKIKSRKQIDKEIPREQQGWWADVAAGQKLMLRQAVQSDLDRCTLGEKRSKNPDDYMCETQTNGSLVSKIALEYMNPEQNVFATAGTHPLAREPLTDEQRRGVINKSWNDFLRGKEDGTSFSWHLSFDIEAAHGIKGDA